MAQQQPVVPGIVLQSDRLAVTGQVGRAGAKDHAVLDQRLGDQLRLVGGAVAQRQVVAAIDQVFVGIVEVDLQAHLRVLAHETATYLVEKRGAERRRRGDTQGTAQRVLQLLHLFGHPLQVHQRLARAFQVQGAGLGQRHAPGGTFEQAHAQFALQVRNSLGDGRRRLAQLLGRTAEAAVLGCSDEDGQGHHLVHGFFLFGTNGVGDARVASICPSYQTRKCRRLE